MRDLHCCYRDQIFNDLRRDFKEIPSTSLPSKSSKAMDEMYARISLCLLHGFYMNAVRSCGATSNVLGSQTASIYRTIPIKRDDEVALVHIHPSSVLSHMNMRYQYLIYQELSVIQGKTYINLASRVDEEELTQFIGTWNEPSHPLQLTGRKIDIPIAKHRPDDAVVLSDPVSAAAGMENSESMNTKRQLSEDSVDDARARYLARKKIKK